MKEIFQNFINECGPIGYVIVFLFLVASIFFFRRFIFLHKIIRTSDGFVNGLKNNLLKGEHKVMEVIHICDETGGPVAAVVRSILSKNSNDVDALHFAAEEAAVVQIPQLQKDAYTVAIIGQILPLLGMLGTVLSLYGFWAHSMPTQSDMQAISSDITKALVTTVLGLTGSVVIQLYNAILREIYKHIVHEMEKSAHEIINYLTESSKLADAMNSHLLDKRAK